MTSLDQTDHDKANFDHAYNRPDPRDYFQTLGPLGYEIPQHACEVFDALLKARDRIPATHARRDVMDVCCSYGLNAALLRYDLTLDDLYSRYRDASIADLSPEQLATADRDFYGERLRPDAPRVVGLDGADQAIEYARRVGLINAGFAENLETGEASPELEHAVSEVGLITITGGIGYITERTIDRLVRAVPGNRLPWVAAFVLRTVPYEQVAEVLRQRGLVTEQLAGRTFRQRRFASAEEERSVLDSVHAHGLDPSGKEEDGWYHCDFFLSRPLPDAERQPVQTLLDP